MDQTSIFFNDGTTTTIDNVGSTMVSVSQSSSTIRCSVALTIRLDGTKCIQHVVFKAEPGGSILNEVQSYATDATVSAQTHAWFDKNVMHEWISTNWMTNIKDIGELSHLL